jgi:hypothetical protein
MEFSKHYNSLPNKLVVDPSLINITDSASEINIISNKVDVISDGSNNIAELNLVGKYQGDNNNLGNAKLHIGAYKSDGTGSSLVGGGICFFSEIDDTGFVNNNEDITDNNLCFYRSNGGDNEAVFYYKATNIGNNGIIFKKNVGIHSTNPSATLHIQGSKEYQNDSTSHLDVSDNTHSTHSTPALNDVKLSLLINPDSNDGNIGLNGSIYYYSDERIKTEIEEVPDSLALSQINNIEPKYYHYRDPLKRRDVKTVGFIAQNVNEQLPNAIYKQTDFIPNALHKVADSEWKEENGTYSLIFENLALDISNSTKRVKFIVCDKEDRSDTTDLILSCESDNKTFIFNKKWREIFVYGSEVNDVLTIDKAQIFALHHSGIQELSKQLNEKDAKISALETENASIKTRLEALEASVLALQNN